MLWQVNKMETLVQQAERGDVRQCKKGSVGSRGSVQEYKII